MIHHLMRYFSFKKTATAPVEAPVAMTLAYVDLDNFLGSLKHGYLISSAVQHIDSLMETLHLMSSPSNAAHLAQSIAELRSSKAIERELLDETKD